MKKAITKRGVTLVEMPEIDFSKYRVRRNFYAARITREGVQLAHSERSLRIPVSSSALITDRPTPL